MMKRCEEVERRLGEHANAQVTELDGVLASVWTRAGTREVRHEMGPRIHKISSALPCISNRLFSYWGVANGFRSLLAVLSCNLMASYAYVFVGALGAAVSSWLAIRSAGKETEKQIRTVMGEELGKALRERAHATADGIAGMAMQPCEDAIDRRAPAPAPAARRALPAQQQSRARRVPPPPSPPPVLTGPGPVPPRARWWGHFRGPAG